MASDIVLAPEEELQQQSDEIFSPSPVISDMRHDCSRSPNTSKNHKFPDSAQTATSSTAQLNMSPAGSKTPESTTGCRSPGSPGSPLREDSCPICLGPFTDKCAAGSCLHNFCLVCLKEWCKQKPVCPLCKQSFSKILYDIKSETDYKEWNVPTYPRECSDFGLTQFRGLRHYIHAERRFHEQNSLLRLRGRRIPSASLPRARQQQPYHDRGSSLFRLSIYTNNVWIQPLADLTGRYRESSPTLYREQTALTHRLVPWINRELAALVPASRIAVVLSHIMELIERYPIDSREFRQALRPELGSRTRHFVHEFYNFARSPYDMVGHDNASQYVPRYHQVRGSSAEDTDSDVIIEVESDGVVIEPESTESISIPSRVAREETIGNDGSVFISSDSDSSINEDTFENLHAVAAANNARLNSLLTRTRNFFAQITEQPLTEERGRTSNNLEEPGPSGVSSSSSLSIKREIRPRSCSPDSDECLIVDVLKPKKERTPEIINLSSNSGSETCRKKNKNSSEGSKAHWKKKLSKKAVDGQESSRHTRSRKKPRLDRTSFSLHISGMLNCQHRADHNYFNESGSPRNHSSGRRESEERHYRKRRHQTQLPENKRTISFNSDSSSDDESAARFSRVAKTRCQKVLEHRRLYSSVSRSRSSSPEASCSSSPVARKSTKHKVKKFTKTSKKSGTNKSSNRTDISSAAFHSKRVTTSTSKYNFRKTSNSDSRKKRRRRYSSSSSISSSPSGTISSCSDFGSCSSSSSDSSASSISTKSLSSSSSSMSSDTWLDWKAWKKSANNENSKREYVPRNISHKRRSKPRLTSSRARKEMPRISDSERGSSSKNKKSRSKSDAHRPTTKQKKHSK